MFVECFEPMDGVVDFFEHPVNVHRAVPHRGRFVQARGHVLFHRQRNLPSGPHLHHLKRRHPYVLERVKHNPHLRVGIVGDEHLEVGGMGTETPVAMDHFVLPIVAVVSVVIFFTLDDFQPAIGHPPVVALDRTHVQPRHQFQHCVHKCVLAQVEGPHGVRVVHCALAVFKGP